MSSQSCIGPAWREAIAGVHKEVLQHGAATVNSLSYAVAALQMTSATKAGLNSTEAGASDALVLVAQQLAQHHSSIFSSQPHVQQLGGHASAQQQQQGEDLQQEHQQGVLQACCTLCDVITSSLTILHAQQQQHSKKKYGWVPKPQQQQPQQQQHALLSARAATSISASLRSWADPQLVYTTNSNGNSSDSNGSWDRRGMFHAWQLQLQQAAVRAVGALLQQHLPLLAAHERAAVLTLLQSLAQPPPTSRSNSFFLPCAGEAEQQKQQQQQASNELQLACTTAHILGQLCKRKEGNDKVSLTADECDSSTKALVDALTSACNIRSGSSSGSSASALHTSSNSGTRSSSTGGSSNRGRIAEDAAHANYYAVLLSALQQAIPSNLHSASSSSHSWSAHAAAVTEVACKLFTYGTHQQQQQPLQAAMAVSSLQTASGSSSATASSINRTAAAPAAAASTAEPTPRRYVPPHLRRAGAAAVALPAAVQPQAVQVGQLQPLIDGPLAGALLQQQQLWRQQDDPLSDIDSSGEWSDNELGPGARPGSSSSSSSSRQSSQSQQQQQSKAARVALLQQDPIKAYRVRIALLQLLKWLAQTDAKLLHPFLAALLPTQLPLQPRPLSPHLLTVLLYDPCLKARVLSAGVLSALLEGPAARALMAVAEAKGEPRTAARGFVTMSTSLGHMLLALHTGLLAAVQAAVQALQPQQQQQQVLLPSSSLLCAVLHALCAAMSITPYERLPGHLLTDIVQANWGLWQQQQPAVESSSSSTEEVNANMHAILVSESGAGCAVETAVAAVIAQAVATKKADAGLGAWLRSNTAAAAAAAEEEEDGRDRAQSKQQQQQRGCLTDANSTVPSAAVPRLALGSSSMIGQHQCCGSSSSNASSSSSRRSLAWCLLEACMSGTPLLRIEALAALRGICINYPEALPVHTAAAEDVVHGNSSCCCWAAVLSAVRHSVAASELHPRSPRVGSTTPRRTSASSSSSSCITAAGAAGNSSSEEASPNASPEDKAAQHAVKLLGDWLAAEWKIASNAAAVETPTASQSTTAAVHDALINAGGNTQQQQQQLGIRGVVIMWGEALGMLLSPQLQQHPCYIIRSAGVALIADIPAAVWQQLPDRTKEQLLVATAAAAQLDAVAAARATACKVLGSIVVLPGMLSKELHQPGLGSNPADDSDCLVVQLVLQPLASCMKDSAVSVRINASWGIANACDALKQQDRGSSSSSSASGAAAVPATVVQLLSENALAAAVADSEKVRANGIRAVGALVTAWQPDWGLSSSSSSSGAFDWSWVPGWLSGAIGQLQSCLASRSPKVVWNAAYAVAGLLRNSPLQQLPKVSACLPALLLVLVVLVRDSSNYKIKTHAAAALAAVGSRQCYGDCFADAVLVLAAALEVLNGGSSSSCAAAEPIDDDGKFPNFRYVPGLVSQLRTSLLHMLARLQQTDAARLKEPLQRRQQQLEALLSCSSGEVQADAAAAIHALQNVVGVQLNIHTVDAAAAAERQQQQESTAAAAAAEQQSPGFRSKLPSDPFSQDGS